ncbi:MAG: amidohydrolase family protein [Deltaproteobacteria bacterium]|nr:amidohydrolase family protein [Deltaproteobacteria bacterium]
MQRLQVKWMALIALSVIVGMQFWAPVRDAAGAEVEYIDSHNHAPHTPTCVYDDAYDTKVQTDVLARMDTFGIQKTLFMPPPHSPDNIPCGYEHLAELVKRYPDRFAFLRGGESLNVMIQKVVTGLATLQETLPDFVRAAKQLLRDGAVGFGEMAAEHFSLHSGHPYISAPPDHPLFLLLADLAAGHDVPIDLHMEALASDTAFADLPFECSAADENQQFANPAVFPENITAFERLLRHNRRARILWVHAGWDNTGDRTAALTRQLLENHPNLYIQLRPIPIRSAGNCNPLMNKDEHGNIQIEAEWLELISAFPDRFIVGLDSFYSNFNPKELSDEEFAEILEQLLGAGTRFMDKLRQFSPDLVRKVGRENAVRIYKLDEPMICHRPGTPAEQVLRVSGSAVKGHLAHGDTLGPCG